MSANQANAIGVETGPDPSLRKPLLELTDVHTYYGHIHALKGISLDVREGEIVTLIGSNGAGKSTTLRTISGLIAARQGRVTFGEQNLARRSPHRITEMGLGHVPEGRKIFANLTVDENLDIGGYLERDPKIQSARRQQVFELFPRLAERRRQAGGTLSGGEQQMLAIGRALMGDPKLLLLDEPTLGLAPLLVDTIFATILDLNRRGKTILLVEQNAWHALKIAHRGYVLETGSIALHGKASELAGNEMVRRCYLGEG